MSDPLCASSSFNPARVSVQVKVWFQNRRTKYKRQKLEEEGPDSQQKKKGNHHINRWRIATKQASSEDIDVTSEDWKKKKNTTSDPEPCVSFWRTRGPTAIYYVILLSIIRPVRGLLRISSSRCLYSVTLGEEKERII